MKTTLLFLFLLFTQSPFLWSQDSTKIALLGCHEQNWPAPSLSFFADVLQPDYAVWLGDNVYADTKTDPQHIKRQLDILAAKPGFQKLKANTPFFVTWDDHDFGLDGSNKGYIFKEESKVIHREFWELEDQFPAEQDGVYYDEVIQLANGKSIQFIMIDGRFNLDPPKTKHRENLGEKQWLWLESALEKEVDLRFVVCGYQVLLPKLTRWESWAKIGNTRNRLFELIEKTQANNLIFLTGDQHTTEVLRTQKKLDYFTYEIMACGINKTEKPGRAPNRVMGPDRTVNSAPLITVHWEEAIKIHFDNYNADTKTIVSSFEFLLSDIGPKK